MPAKDWRKYNKERIERTITMLVPGAEIKDRIKAVARHDRRSVNSWLVRYIYPKMMDELMIQEERIKAQDRARAAI